MNKASLRRFWKQHLKPLLTCAIVIFSVRSAIADWNDVPTGSMKPTILEGDRVVVNKLAYDLKVPFTTWHLAEWGGPERGDIVVFYSPVDGTRLVKRCIGVPGDQIAMENNRLFVNGSPIDYEPLETAISEQIDSSEREAHQFAAEKLGDRRHAVMVLPQSTGMHSFAPFTVSEGKYFMMGDNRDNSFDSRYFGAVPREKILGRATAVAFSLDRDNYYIPRGKRFFDRLQ